MVKDEITFPDFQKLDLRVGEVIEAEKVVESKHLIRMTVDLGADYGVRTIFAGVADWYTPTQLTGKKFVFVANLEPKKMPSFVPLSGTTAGERTESQGMMCAADVGNKAVLIPVGKKIPAGTIIR